MKNHLLITFVFVSALGFSQGKKWTLQECIHYAFEHNLHIKQSKLEKTNQENNLKTAKKERIPSVSATVSNMASFGQNQDVFGNHRRNDNFNNSVNIGANITLYNGSRLEKQIQKSQYEVEASAYDLERIKSDISLQIAQQYLNILLNREVENINKSAYENAQNHRPNGFSGSKRLYGKGIPKYEISRSKYQKCTVFIGFTASVGGL